MPARGYDNWKTTDPADAAPENAPDHDPTPPEDLTLPECDLCGGEIEDVQEHNFRNTKWGGTYLACDNCIQDPPEMPGREYEPPE